MFPFDSSVLIFFPCILPSYPEGVEKSGKGARKRKEEALIINEKHTSFTTKPHKCAQVHELGHTYGFIQERNITVCCSGAHNSFVMALFGTIYTGKIDPSPHFQFSQQQNVKGA